MTPSERLGRLMGAAEMYLQTGATVDRKRLAIVLNEEFQRLALEGHQAPEPPLPTDLPGEAELREALRGSLLATQRAVDEAGRVALICWVAAGLVWAAGLTYAVSL